MKQLNVAVIPATQYTYEQVRERGYQIEVK